MSNSGFVITDEGLRVASTANPGGPFINITSFQVGSGVNYTPTRAQTALMGTVLYTSAPTSYSVVDDSTVQVLLLMDQTIGTFQFGEVGLFLADGTLFATCVWDSLQEKLRAVGNQAGSIWRIKANILLQQAPALVEVTVINSMSLLEVPDWPSLIAPYNQPSGANAVIVHEADYSGDPILCIRNSDYDWALVDYLEIASGSISDSGASSQVNTLTHPLFSTLYWDTPTVNSTYVIKFANGDIRRLLDVQGNVAVYVPNEPVAPTGAFSVWEDATAYMVDSQTAWASTLEYNEDVTNFNPYWSTPTGVYPNNKGLNQIALPLVTKRPALTDWQRLSTAVNEANTLVNHTTGIVLTEDYIYDPSDNTGEGMYTKSLNYQTLLNAITYITTHYDDPNTVYLETATRVANQVYTYAGPVGIEMLTTFFVNYNGDQNNLFGLLNGGGNLTFSMPTVTGTTNAWNAIRTVTAAIGSIVVNRSGTVSSLGASGGTSNSMYSMYTANGTYQTLFQHAFSDTDGNAWEILLTGAYFGGVTYAFQFAVITTAYASVHPSGQGGLVFAVDAVRPSSAILNQPVLNFPTFNTVPTYTYIAATPTPTPGPTPAPTPPPSTPAPTPAPSGQVVFTTVGSHNVTVPANVYVMEGTLQGGGANGANGSPSGGKGGNGGSSGQRVVANFAVTPGQVLTVYCPPRGAAASIAGVFSAAGGTSTFVTGVAASPATGHGGNGASMPNPSGGTGGVGGDASYNTSNSTPPGPGQGTGNINTGQAGFNASGYGSGGGGGGSDDSTGPGPGGLGTQGFAILTWGYASGYYSIAMVPGQPGGAPFAGGTAAPPPSGGGCFHPNTLVLTAEGAKRIADINPGDIVMGMSIPGLEAADVDLDVRAIFKWSTDVFHADLVSVPVVRVLAAGEPHHYLINGKLQVTEEHPFMTLRGQTWKWVQAKDLVAGDTLRTINSSIDVSSIIRVEEAIPTNNLTIDNPAHTFFVEIDGEWVLVHNVLTVPTTGAPLK